MTTKQKHISILILAFGSVGVLILLLQPTAVREWLKDGGSRLTSMAQEVESVSQAVPAQQVGGDSLAPEVKSPSLQDQVTLLNDQGVALVLDKKYWQGMYLFHQAIELDSSRIEPLLNMAVTLAEVNLSRPADRYFSLAESLDSDYPLLQRKGRGMHYSISEELAEYPLAEALVDE